MGTIQAVVTKRPPEIQETRLAAPTEVYHVILIRWFQIQDPSKTETATLPSQPEKTTQPDKPIDQTPLPPQHEPSGFTHTTPVGNLRKGTAWDDYTFPQNPSEATITVVKVFHDAGGLRAIQVNASSFYFLQPLTAGR